MPCDADRKRRRAALRVMAPMAAAMIALAITASVRAAPAIEIGKPFPVIALPSLEDGAAMSILDFRGQKLILHIFASW